MHSSAVLIAWWKCYCNSTLCGFKVIDISNAMHDIHASSAICQSWGITDIKLLICVISSHISNHCNSVRKHATELQIRSVSNWKCKLITALFTVTFSDLQLFIATTSDRRTVHSDHKWPSSLIIEFYFHSLLVNCCIVSFSFSIAVTFLFVDSLHYFNFPILHFL